MEALKRKRKGARTWVTKETSRLQAMLERPVEEASYVDIQKSLSDLNIKIERLDIVQSNIESEIDEDDLESDIESAFQFLQIPREVVQKAEQRLACVQADVKATPIQELISPGQSLRNSNANLPKIQIKPFSGAFTEWSEFWDKFSAIIDSANLPPVSKFSYLQSLLTGDALATIRGLSLTEANYATAVELLQERYGRKEPIILAHIQRLLTIEVPNVRAVAKLWQVYNELQSNIRSLQSLGVDGQQYGIVLAPIVLSRLPQVFCLEWARISEGVEGDLTRLMDFLKGEISSRERSESYRGSTQSSVSTNSSEQRTTGRKGSAAALNSSLTADLRATPAVFVASFIDLKNAGT